MFPNLDADAVLAATADHWDLSGPLPVPQGDWLACPVCRAADPQPRWWKWHKRTARPTVRERCDVSMKCTACAACWTHGVAVPTAYFQRYATHVGRQIHWREARRALEG